MWCDKYVQLILRMEIDFTNEKLCMRISDHTWMPHNAVGRWRWISISRDTICWASMKNEDNLTVFLPCPISWSLWIYCWPTWRHGGILTDPSLSLLCLRNIVSTALLRTQTILGEVHFWVSGFASVIFQDSQQYCFEMQAVLLWLVHSFRSAFVDRSVLSIVLSGRFSLESQKEHIPARDSTIYY